MQQPIFRTTRNQMPIEPRDTSRLADAIAQQVIAAARGPIPHRVEAVRNLINRAIDVRMGAGK